MAERTTLTDKIDQLTRLIKSQPDGNKIDDMVTVLTTAVHTLEVNTKAIEKITLTIYGNGKPGLQSDVRELQGRMSIIVKAAWIVIGVVLTTATGSIIWLIASHPIR